jgi:hypothetical protein
MLKAFEVAHIKRPGMHPVGSAGFYKPDVDSLGLSLSVRRQAAPGLVRRRPMASTSPRRGPIRAKIKAKVDPVAAGR